MAHSQHEWYSHRINQILVFIGNNNREELSDNSNENTNRKILS